VANFSLLRIGLGKLAFWTSLNFLRGEFFELSVEHSHCHTNQISLVGFHSKQKGTLRTSGAGTRPDGVTVWFSAH
jgi:hypothetical protein